jgi:hypothetical protein
MFFLIGQLSFPRMVRPIDKDLVHLMLAEVDLLAGHEVLMQVDGNSALIVGDPPVILGPQLNHHPIHLLNIIIILY